MKIEINNFANIKSLCTEFEQDKLNFIYGISGSGKTSIATALMIRNSDYSSYKTFGVEEDPIIKVDTDIEFEMFDEQSISEYIFSKSGSGIYDVIYGENEELLALKNELHKFLERKELNDVRNIISTQNSKIKQLEENLGVSRTKSGNLRKTGLYKDLSNSRKRFDSNPNINPERKKWIKDGYKLIEDNLCPFCERDLSEEILDKLTKLCNELPESYIRVLENVESLKSLNITVDVNKIDDEDTQTKLREEIELQYSILVEMERIRDALNIPIYDDVALEKKVNIKTPSESTVKIFTDNNINILELIEELKKDTEGYTLLKRQYNGKLQSTIKRNIQKINNDIQYFGINYKFAKNNILNKNDNYSLVHTRAIGDTSDCLSTGEKNIVSLILFLTSHVDKNLIIDDPASSFDEYRREQILEYMFKKIYSYGKRTTIILSHDQVFLKFMTKNYMSDVTYNKNIGNVFHFENHNGDAHTVPIATNDMQAITSHIREKLSQLDSYSKKILNLRLLYEITDVKSIEYKYLSAVLHSKNSKLTVEKMMEILEELNVTEDFVLNEIYNFSGIKLSKFDSKSFDLNLDGLTKFEQLCLIRELVDGNDKDELNSVIHFNYALNHLLNPYKFNFQSSKSYSILNKYKTKNQ